MSKFDWDEQVQVKVLEPNSARKDDVIENRVLEWDGISLSEAVERCMGLPPDKRARANIFASGGCYSGKDIEALFQRHDFPHSTGLN